MTHPAPAPPERFWDDPAALLGVDEARARILAAFTPLPAVRLPLGQVRGLVLAVDVIAPADLPPFANSAMDGFALRAADTAGATAVAPVTLPVIGEAAAGYPAEVPVAPGTSVRIM